jgi:phosphopantetheinyl transferase (holo-ACP synthase)
MADNRQGAVDMKQPEMARISNTFNLKQMTDEELFELQQMAQYAEKHQREISYTSEKEWRIKDASSKAWDYYRLWTKVLDERLEREDKEL